jgi:hypothetical protein
MSASGSSISTPVVVGPPTEHPFSWRFTAQLFIGSALNPVNVPVSDRGSPLITVRSGTPRARNSLVIWRLQPPGRRPGSPVLPRGVHQFNDGSPEGRSASADGLP